MVNFCCNCLSKLRQSDSHVFAIDWLNFSLYINHFMKKITVKKKSSMRIRQKWYKSFDNIISMLFFIFSLCIISTKKSQFFRHYNRGQHFVQKSRGKLDSFSYFCVLRLFFQFFWGRFWTIWGKGWEGVLHHRHNFYNIENRPSPNVIFVTFVHLSNQIYPIRTKPTETLENGEICR